MNTVKIIFEGFILALGLIVPLGIQNLFVFNQGAIQKSFVRVLPVIITTSICDTLLIVLGVLGLSIVLVTNQWLISSVFLVGFLFLMYMGWVNWKAKPVNIEIDKNNYKVLSVKKQVLFATSVSLLNPHAYLDTIAVIGTNSLYYQGLNKVVFTLSSISVSWIWFLGLALAGKFSVEIDKSGKFSCLINKGAAIIIWITGISLLWRI